MKLEGWMPVTIDGRTGSATPRPRLDIRPQPQVAFLNFAQLNGWTWVPDPINIQVSIIPGHNTIYRPTGSIDPIRWPFLWDTQVATMRMRLWTPFLRRSASWFPQTCNESSSSDRLRSRQLERQKDSRQTEHIVRLGSTWGLL